MVGLAFASSPLYRAFCEATGFGGTTLRADKAPGAVAGQVGVRFDANIHPGLPWRFEPEQLSVEGPAGRANQDFLSRSESQRAGHRPGRRCSTCPPTRSANISRKSSASASPSRRSKPGETVDMPVVFFVDPKIKQDPDTKDVDEITLSYTFYPVETGTAAR